MKSRSRSSTGRLNETVLLKVSTFFQPKAAERARPFAENWVLAGNTIANSEPRVSVPLRFLPAVSWFCNCREISTQSLGPSLGEGPQEFMNRNENRIQRKKVGWEWRGKCCLLWRNLKLMSTAQQLAPQSSFRLVKLGCHSTAQNAINYGKVRMI